MNFLKYSGTALFIGFATLPAMAGENWFTDSKLELCRSAKYNIPCNPCKDGWSVCSYSLRGKKPEIVGFRASRSCGGDNNCGNRFEIEGKEIKCETFVELLQDRKKKYGSRLGEKCEGGG